VPLLYVLHVTPSPTTLRMFLRVLPPPLSICRHPQKKSTFVHVSIFTFRAKKLLISLHDYKQTYQRRVQYIMQRSLRTYVLLPVGVKTGKKREEKTMAGVKVKLPPVLTLRRKQKFRFLACKKVPAIRRKVPGICRKVLVNRRKVPAICKKVPAIFRKLPLNSRHWQESSRQSQEGSCHLQKNSAIFRNVSAIRRKIPAICKTFAAIFRKVSTICRKVPAISSQEKEKNFLTDCK
jgi:hypothetical protein